MTTPWAANLRLLETRHDPLLRRLGSALARLGPAVLDQLVDRANRPLPWVRTTASVRPLWTRFDRSREAELWAPADPSETIVVWGTPHPEVLGVLQNRGCRKAVFVEPRLEVWQTVFTAQDWTSDLTSLDWIPFWGTAAEWKTFLTTCLVPLWDGNLQVLGWRASTQDRDGEWNDFYDQTRQTAENWASDLSTQAKFSRRWYRNTLVNISHLADVSGPDVTGARVVVAGAGPSLDEALDAVTDQSFDFLFAADTALPALVSRGLKPDVVFCLDGQHHSYHHFVAAPPASTLIAADLAALPLLSRRSSLVLRFLSGHPLGTVLRRAFPELPLLDASSQNVAGLAAQTAWNLGAAEVQLWGIDLAYRDGQAYAHGTYPETLASRKVSRLQPFETLLSQRVYSSPASEKTLSPSGQSWVTTPLLKSYRALFPTGKRSALVGWHNRATQDRAAVWLEDWKKRLTNLPLPASTESYLAFWSRLPLDLQQDWQALWPLTASLVREGIDSRDRAAASRELALQWYQH